MTVVTPSADGLPDPSAPFDGMVGRLTSSLSGEAGVDAPSASSGQDYTIECRYYLPTAVPDTTASMHLMFYYVYKHHVGGMELFHAPRQFVHLYMSSNPPNDFHITWESGSDFPPLAVGAWHDIKLVLSGATAVVWLDGFQLPAPASWASLAPGAVGGCYGVGHSLIQLVNPPLSYSSHFDALRVYTTTTAVHDWQMYD